MSLKTYKLAYKLLPNTRKFLNSKVSDLKIPRKINKNNIKLLGKKLIKIFENADKYLIKDLKQNKSKFEYIVKKIYPRVTKKIFNQNIDSNQNSETEKNLLFKITISFVYLLFVALTQNMVKPIVESFVERIYLGKYGHEEEQSESFIFEDGPYSEERFNAIYKVNLVVEFLTASLLAPITEELARLILEKKYKAGIVYSVLIETIESGSVLIQHKNISAIVIRLITGGHLLFGYIQRYILRKIEDKTKATAIAFFVSSLLHAIHNGLFVPFVAKQETDELIQNVAKELEKEE